MVGSIRFPQISFLKLEVALELKLAFGSFRYSNTEFSKFGLLNQRGAQFSILCLRHYNTIPWNNCPSWVMLLL